MKKIFASFIVVLLLSVSAIAQTNTITSFYSKPLHNNNGHYVNISFTADSLGEFMSDIIELGEMNNTDWMNGIPITFRYKGVGTYGVPATSVHLLGCFTTALDTIVLDSIRSQVSNQTEGDTIGVLTLNYKKAPSGYRVFIRNRTADIHSGTLQLFFPKPNALKP